MLAFSDFIHGDWRPVADLSPGPRVGRLAILPLIVPCANNGYQESLRYSCRHSLSLMIAIIEFCADKFIFQHFPLNVGPLKLLMY